MLLLFHKLRFIGLLWLVVRKVSWFLIFCWPWRVTSLKNIWLQKEWIVFYIGQMKVYEIAGMKKYYNFKIQSYTPE